MFGRISFTKTSSGSYGNETTLHRTFDLEDRAIIVSEPLKTQTCDYIFNICVQCAFSVAAPPQS